MGVKMSGETMQSFNNSSRRCAHASAIFSPPGFALPELGVSREAIVFTTCYVGQQGTKAGHTVGIEALVGFQGLMLTCESETLNSFLRPLKNNDFKEDTERKNRVLRHC